MSRPGEVPTAAGWEVSRVYFRRERGNVQPMYVIKNPPSGLARISSVIEASSARLLLRNLGLYGLEVSK